MVYIYILKLQKNKYYVGKTNYPNFRINEHFNSDASEWTKLYKPIEVFRLIPNCDDYDEDKYTKIYMDKYGIDNVRGGSFVSRELDPFTIKLLSKKNENKISLKSLLTHSPNSILQILELIELLDKLKNYRITVGDIVLNIHSSEYETLEDIINDAEFIYDNFDKFTIDTKIEDIPIEVIRDNLHLGRDKFYKNMALFLSKFPCEIFKELSEGRKIIDIQNKIKSRIVII